MNAEQIAEAWTLLDRGHLATLVERGQAPSMLRAGWLRHVRAELIGVLLVVLAGCSSGNESTGTAVQTVAQCKEQYSSQNGYGAASDPPTCTSPPPPAPEPVCEPPTPESVALECSAAGVTCDPSAFITREGAECIAQLVGLEPGLEPWSVTLLFAHDEGRPMWVIQNVTHQDPSDCAESGRSLRIDALSGDVEPIAGWSSIC